VREKTLCPVDTTIVSNNLLDVLHCGHKQERIRPPGRAVVLKNAVGKWCPQKLGSEKKSRLSIAFPSISIQKLIDLHLLVTRRLRSPSHSRFRPAIVPSRRCHNGVPFHRKFPGRSPAIPAFQYFSRVFQPTTNPVHLVLALCISYGPCSIHDVSRRCQ
jgi:hypothetical protein